MHAHVRRLVSIAAGLVASLVVSTKPAAVAPSSGPVLTVSGTGFHLDGRPVFLLSASVFDALGPTAPADRDLDALKGWGVNTIRVWAHWHVPIYQADGGLTADGRSRLLALVERLRARAMVLELVLLRPGQLPTQRYAIFSSEAARSNAVRSITSTLLDARNVLFDLYNEHDHSDGPISHAAARGLRDEVKARDPGRIVTISSTAGHVITDDGRVGETEARNLREEAGQQPGGVGVDVVAPHFPRTEDWASATGARIAAIRAALDQVSLHLPIYLTEERRADERTSLAADAYLRAVSAARERGAAGWTFHTAAGFALAKKSFVDALTPAERSGLERLRR